MRYPKHLASSALAVLLSACAGTDFVRPADDAFTLGKTTTADVQAKMGSPRTTGSKLTNEQMVTTYSYAYASAGGEAKYSNVTAARGINFGFFNDVLVDREFMSSFAADCSDFDESRIGQIKKGASTRSDVIALLGPPSGEAIYPMIESKTDRALIYSYNQVTGSAFNMKFFVKTLKVSYNPSSQLVTDVNYTENGPKPVPK